jgi:hypothetical protein
MDPLRPEDLRAYANRDWASLARVKQDHWLAERQRASPLGLLDLTASLQAQAQLLNPSWPSSQERDEDLANHILVSAALRQVRLP